jgi:hypothetical protein
MTMAPQESSSLPKARQVPEFASEDEERAWWASHDTSELPGEDTDLRYVGPDAEHARAVTVRLDHQTVERLQALAAREHIDHHALVRRWVVERLRQESSAA